MLSFALGVAFFIPLEKKFKLIEGLAIMVNRSRKNPTSDEDSPNDLSAVIAALYDSDPEREWGRAERHRTEFAVTLRALAGSLPGLSEPELLSALRLLEEFGCVRRLSSHRGARSSVVRGPSGARRFIDVQASRRGARRALWRLSEMQKYVRSRRCRRASIATYFGERAPRCTGCDRCG